MLIPETILKPKEPLSEIVQFVFSRQNIQLQVELRRLKGSRKELQEKLTE